MLALLFPVKSLSSGRGLFWEQARGALVSQQIMEPQGRESARGDGEGGTCPMPMDNPVIKNKCLLDELLTKNLSCRKRSLLMLSSCGQGYNCDKAGDISAGWKEELSYPDSCLMT